MNQAERRSCARHERSQSRDRAAFRIAADAAIKAANLPVKMFDLTLAKNDATPATEYDADALLMSPLLNIDRLSRGSLNDEGFIDLNEANVSAFCIAAIIYQHATPDSKQIIGQAQPYFEQAAEVLGEIGYRKMQRGKYIATGDELNAIKESMRLYREVIGVATKGMIVKGIIRAKELVDQKLLRVWRENERKQQ